PYRLLQRITVFITPSQAAAVLSLPLMTIYLLISGSSIPAIRSFIMISLFLFGLLIGRKGFWLNSLLLAAVLISVWDPSALLSLSFQLSFAAVLFIGLAVGCSERSPAEELADPRDKPGEIRGRAFSVLRSSFLISLAASIGTAPLVVYAFHYISLISPIANLLFMPLIGFLLLPVALLAAFVFLFTGHYPFSDLIGPVTDLALKGVSLLASVPFADLKVPAVPVISVISFYGGICLYFFFRQRHGWPQLRAMLVPSGLVFVSLFPVLSGSAGMAVTFLDVGQGDAAVIEASGKTVVIDIGRTGRETGAFLSYLGRRKVDALVLTHADDDHSAGASYLAGRF
ncbi:MAG: MBL fold metallo-hydrolase, partial [Candidatus Dadabacteria bacterium]